MGDYSVTTIEILSTGAPVDTTLSIAALSEPDDDGNNIVFTDFLGFANVPAFFDADLGTITLSPYTGSNFKLSFNGPETATIAVPAAGTLSNSSDYFVFKDASNAYLAAYATIDATRK